MLMEKDEQASKLLPDSFKCISPAGFILHSLMTSGILQAFCKRYKRSADFQMIIVFEVLPPLHNCQHEEQPHNR